MILLVTPIEGRSQCSAVLQEATGDKIVIAANLLEATTLLRAQDFRVAVFDQHLAEREPHETDIAFEHLGTAVPVVINLVVTGPDRLAREVQAALRRQAREVAAARDAATAAVHSELGGTVRALAMALNSALEIADLPAEVAENLRSATTHTEKLQSQLALTV